MPLRELSPDEVGLPHFATGPGSEAKIFSLSSHKRARQALEFGLSAKVPGFNIFVVGADRSGRMSATQDFLQGVIKDWPTPPDWVYLNNFEEPHRPEPYALPAGEGRRFCDRMTELVPQLREALSRAFGNEAYEAEVQARRDQIQRDIANAMEALRAEARQSGLDLAQTSQGIGVMLAPGPDGKPIDPNSLSEEDRKAIEAAHQAISEKLHEIDRQAARQQLDFAKWLRESNATVAERAVAGLIAEVADAYKNEKGLGEWFKRMHADVLEHLQFFRPPSAEAPIPISQLPERRYAANLIVGHAEGDAPRVVLEADPTAEHLFGHIQYQQAGGVLETDFTLIRPGALHRANGGVLVLRAESVAADARVWRLLKGALRDRELRVAETYGRGVVPLAGSPQPIAIPLDVKIVIVGSPRWYYAFFSVDPELQTYFPVKADIDAEMEASEENLSAFAALIQEMAERLAGRRCDDEAVARLIGMASRWSGDRRRLSARFEMIEDVVQEAAHLIAPDNKIPIGLHQIKKANRNRRRRNARIEDHMHRSIAEGAVMIDVAGSVTGQINALTVRDLGDHAFGAPSRVTARASIGRRGVSNIERDVAMGGPIQQKGAMILQGFLAGRFARRFPLSFNCSITFEQNYGGVEGDSASLAELLAVLSDLSGLPLRQDCAITGSVNQRGQTQVVGGVHHKIEGFYRACTDAGDLSGSQGVLIPRANEPNVVLRDEVAEAVADGRFHIWSADTVDEAIEHFTGVPAGVADASGNYPADTVYGKVMAVLEDFDRALDDRPGPTV